MGKKLIIKGADFSANGTPYSEVDITNLFTWSTSGAYKNNGDNQSSDYFKRSNIVDISSYVGMKMNITWCAWKNSSNNVPSYYGIFFIDENDEIISNRKIDNPGGSYNALGGFSKVIKVDIPVNAVSFKTMYFRGGSSGVSFDFDDFSCIVSTE